jgi:hypothetical protein
MDPAGLVAMFEGLKADVSAAAVDAADAMGELYEDRLVNYTLKRAFHPPSRVAKGEVGFYYKAHEGAPPAYASGNLAKSIRRSAVQAMGPGFAQSSVYATANYAALLEEGGYTWGNPWMHWLNNHPPGSWFMREVHIPKHPYMGPTTREVIVDGSLRRSAVDAFSDVVEVYLRSL